MKSKHNIFFTHSIDPIDNLLVADIDHYDSNLKTLPNQLNGSLFEKLAKDSLINGHVEFAFRFGHFE